PLERVPSADSFAIRRVESDRRRGGRQGRRLRHVRREEALRLPGVDAERAGVPAAVLAHAERADGRDLAAEEERVARVAGADAAAAGAVARRRADTHVVAVDERAVE